MEARNSRTGPSWSVLLVDDDAYVLQMAEAALRYGTGSWEVHRASSGAEALRKSEQLLPDLIVLDVMMPLMDGVSTLESLRETQSMVNVPVVFMTATPDCVRTLVTARRNILGVIHKPFSPVRLSGRLEGLMRQHLSAA